MPLVKLECSVKIDDAKKAALAKDLTGIVCSVTGKPEQYTAAVVSDIAVITFASKPEKAAFVEVRGIGGLTPQNNKKLSSEICALLEKSLGVGQEFVYLNFIDVPASNWGWKGSTFG